MFTYLENTTNSIILELSIIISNSGPFQSLTSVFLSQNALFFFVFLTISNQASGDQLKSKVLYEVKMFYFYLFFKKVFIFILRYNTALVLPYIDMTLPQVYTSS